jgi:serine/threonine-protein kinase
VKAEQSYKRAIALQPEYWASHSQLGAFHFKHGEYDRAAEMFRRVTELTPDNERGFANLGAVLFKAGRFEEARRAYTSSIQVKPIAGAYTNLGTLEFFSGRYPEAAAAFDQAVRLMPANYLYWANLGDAYRWTPQGRSRSGTAYRKAIDLAQGEIALNPMNDTAHRTLATSLAKTGELAGARGHIERALEIDPADPDTMYAAAIVATLEGKRNKAIRWLDKACEAGLGVREIEHEPEFERLRGLPTFQKVLEAAKRGT